MRRFMRLVVLPLAVVTAGHARSPGDSTIGVCADHVGTTVRDVHGRRVGTVRDIEYDRRGGVLNVVIWLGVLPGGGDRYVVVPWEHLDVRSGELRFRGARERLVDAPRHADDPGQ